MEFLGVGPSQSVLESVTEKHMEGDVPGMGDLK